MLRTPRAWLLDFGGVLVDAPRQAPAPPDLVQRLHELTDGAVPAERIAADLVEGHRRYGRWRDATSDEHAPIELSHERVWHDFITADWPAPAREAVRVHATALSYATAWHDGWAVRPGIPEALRAATDAGLPLAVVSNALCGAAHRDFLAAAGLGTLFAVQLYSDEIGLRKPNPELARRAADRIGVPVEDCWFVGDMVDRDILCARRAGAGAAVLMRSSRTARKPVRSEVTPDAVVDDGFGLLDLLGGAG